MTSTIVFDFDGTIADTLEITVQAFNLVAPDFNLPRIEKNDIAVLKNMSAVELLAKYHLTPWALFRLTQKIRAAVKKDLDHAKMFSGMEKVLSTLKKQNVHVGILTSNSIDNVESFLEKQNVSEIDFVISERNVFGKAKSLSKLMRKRKLGKDSVVYIGDEVRDIDAAQKVGIESIGVTWGFNSKERLQQAQPTCIVDTPLELLHELDCYPLVF